MKKTMLWGVCVLLAGLICLSACAREEEMLRINPEIEVYTPTMSSTPGIGLIAAYSRDLKNSDYKFHWTAEEGTFLHWNRSGKGRIEELGDDVYTNEHKVYWTVRWDERPAKREFRVHLSVVRLDTLEVIDATSLWIRQDDEGMFRVETD